MATKLLNLQLFLSTCWVKGLKIEPWSKIEPWRDLDPHNGGLEAQKGALEWRVYRPVFADFHHFKRKARSKMKRWIRPG